MSETLPPEGVAAAANGDPSTPPDLALAGSQLFIMVSARYPAAGVPQAAGTALGCIEIGQPPGEVYCALKLRPDLIGRIATVATAAHARRDIPPARTYDVHSTLYRMFGLATAMHGRLDLAGLRGVIDDYDSTYKQRGRTGALEHFNLIKAQLEIPDGEWGWPSWRYQ